MRTKAIISSILILLYSCLSPVIADRGMGSISLSASPNFLPADGKSVSTVTAQVRDREGKFVPDGTEIRFSASLGVIEESSMTSSGVARVKLISSDISGDCIITATWVEGQAVSQLVLPFGEGLTAAKDDKYISVDAAEYMAYSMNYRVLEALGNVRIRHRGLAIEAQEAQIDMDTGRVIARGGTGMQPLKIQKTDGVVEGDMLIWTLSGNEGLLLSVARGRVEKVDFSKAVPEFKSDQAYYLPEDFEFEDLSDSTILVKSTEATVFPNDKIQFKRASVYVNGKRMITLPYYVLSLNDLDPQESQYLGYSTGGLTLNLPVYYSLTPSFSGAVHVRHGESTGWGDYGTKPGWFVDLRQKYNTEKFSGQLVVSQVTSGDWGAHFQHSQDLGNDTQAYMYLDYPSHRDLFGNVNISRSFGDYSVGLSAYGTKNQGGHESLSTDAYVQTRAKKIGNTPLSYTISSRSVYATGSGVVDDGFSQSLQSNIYSSPVRIADNLSLRSSLGLGYIWGDSSTSGLSTIGTTMLDWKISPYSSFRLSYRYADRASVYTSSTGKQTLSASCILTDQSRKWRASIYAIKGLDYSSESLFADLSYRLSEDWRLGLRSTMNQYAGSSYNDLEFSVGKIIGGRELIAVWSQSQKKVMFELGAGGF